MRQASVHKHQLGAHAHFQAFSHKRLQLSPVSYVRHRGEWKAHVSTILVDEYGLMLLQTMLKDRTIF